MNTFGKKYRITILGSSHGNLVGIVIEGLPAGVPLDINFINEELKKRRPGNSKITTPRQEQDKVIIETGIFRGKTTGDPILVYIRNKDVDSSYYEEIRDVPRPGHADLPARIKYRDQNDYRGGGRFSGRMTAALVIAGAIAQQILNKMGIHIISYAKEIGGFSVNPDLSNLDADFIYSEKNLVRTSSLHAAEKMITLIEAAKKQGDSIGGIVECVIRGLPIGVGEPFFDSMESMIAHMMFSIPAVKAIEFGTGFQAARMRGSQHNDPYRMDDEGRIVTLTNNAGGIIGGLSNGMPVIFRVAFKPPASIRVPQKTLHLKTKKIVQLQVRGRHDPCIVPRAVPVVTNATAIVLFDLLLRGGFVSL